MRHGARRSDRDYEHNAREMARRAGMSVREWLDAYGPEPKQPDRGYDALAERLESLADRFERPLRTSSATRGRMDEDLLRAMDAVSRLAELSERQALQHETAPRQEWPQRAPTELVEEAQKPVLEALKAVEKRLAAIEDSKAMPREMAATPASIDPAMTMMAEALRAIGQRFESLENRASPIADPRINELSSRIDGMRSAIAAASTASASPPPAFESNVSRTINEITSRQRALDGGKTGISGAGSANKAFELFDSRLQDLTRSIADSRSPPPVVIDTSRIEQQIGELAGQIAAITAPSPSGDGAASAKLEEKILRLSQQIAEMRGTEPSPAATLPAKLEEQLGQLTAKIETLAQKPSPPPVDPVTSRIETQLQVLAEKLEKLHREPASPASQISPSHIDGLTGRIDALRNEIMARQVPDYGHHFSDLKQDITTLMMNMQGLSSQAALQDLTAEIHALRDKVEQSRQQGLSAGEADYLEDLTHELQAALQNVRSTDNLAGVEASIRAISERLDYLNGSARVDEGVINQLAGNLERLTARVEELGQQVVSAPAKSPDNSLSDVLQGLIDRLDQQRGGTDVSEALRSLQERLDQNQRDNDLPDETVERLAERVASETAGKLDNVNAMLDRLSRRIDEIGTARTTAPAPQDTPRSRSPQRIVMPTPRAAVAADTPAPLAGADMSSAAANVSGEGIETHAAPVREPLNPPSPISETPAIRRTRNLVSERPLPPGEGDMPIDPGAERPTWRAPREGMRNQYLNAAREAAIAAAEESEARNDSVRSSRSAADIFDQEEKTGLKARIGNLFKRKPKAVTTIDDDDSFEPRIVEPRRMMSGADINLNPENAGLQAQITNRRKPILVGIAVVLIMLMGLQILPGMVSGYVSKLKDASLIKKEQTITPQADPAKPQDGAPRATPNQQQGSAPRVIEAPASNEITGSLPKSPAEAVTATGRVMAPPGVTISGGWANETGPSGRPVIDGKVPNSLVAAAEKGIPEAAYELGSRYLEGRGVGLSVREAAQWYERAAQAGYAPAQFRLGSMYEKGNGVARDLLKAKTYYEQAASQGNAKAMHNLAVIHAEGIEGKPDYKGAAVWFLRGAEYGIVDSQYNLAILYARGLGVETNLAESYKWFALAADGGDKDAAKKREDVAARLDGPTLATAKLAAQTFFVKKEPDGVSDATIGSNRWSASPLTTSSTSGKPKPAPTAIR